MNTDEYGIFWRQARRQRGMTQKQMADALGFGTPQFVSNVERGISRYPLALIPKLIKKLGLNPASVINLILREEEKRIRRALTR